MNLNDACKNLNINENNINKEIIKKAYLKYALLFHPDKTKYDSSDEFIKIRDSYQFLNSYLEKNAEKDNNFLISVISNFTNQNKQQISLFVDKIQSICNETTINILQKANRDKAVAFINYLEKYHIIFGVSDNFLKKLSEIKSNKLKEPYYFSPSLKNLFDQELFLFENENDKFCIPLWHSNLEFDNNIQIILEPKLPSNVIIDDDNNIIINQQVHIKDILSKKVYTVNLYKDFDISIEQLKFKKIQNIIFKNQGIPKINHINLFSVEEIADVIINLQIIY